MQSQFTNNLGKPISILLPICNEADVIDGVVQNWLEVLEVLPEGSCLEFEDANSKDGTAEKLSHYAFMYPQKVIVRYRPDRDGFSKALARLLAGSKNEWVFVADSDGQYEPRDIFLHLKKFHEGVDFVKGVKINRKDGLPRRFFSFLINRFINVYYGFPFLDYNSSHYLISRQLLDNLQMNTWFFKYSINIELTLRAILSNAKYEVVYVQHGKREQGVSRGNPPLKFLGYGFQAFRDIRSLKKKY